MPTVLNDKLESRPTPLGGVYPIESAMRGLASTLARASAETAGAFFCSQATLGAAWEAPRIPESARLNCSQKNIGANFEMLCNLATDADEFAGLFPVGLSDPMRLDAFCELANCICGTVLAEALFREEFGNLVPCVPCSGAGCPVPGARKVAGAFRLAGTWIHFTFEVKETAGNQDPIPLSGPRI